MQANEEANQHSMRETEWRLESNPQGEDGQGVIKYDTSRSPTLSRKIQYCKKELKQHIRLFDWGTTNQTHLRIILCIERRQLERKETHRLGQGDKHAIRSTNMSGKSRMRLFAWRERTSKQTEVIIILRIIRRGGWVAEKRFTEKGLVEELFTGQTCQ